jgi:hypothetical protein
VPDGGWVRQCRLLSTDPDLSAPAVVEASAHRWTVEPLFAALKLTDGMGAMGQRGRRTLLRWLHLVQIKDALARRFGDIEAFRLLPTTQKKTGPARGTGPPVSAAAA